jgi:maltose-binding protein MalE
VQGLVILMLSTPSLGKAQDSGPPQPNIPSSATPMLRRVLVRHISDSVLEDTTVKEEEQKTRLVDRPTAEMRYDQTKTDNVKKALVEFWKEKGITVDVRTTLTEIPNAPGRAELGFAVYKRR